MIVIEFVDNFVFLGITLNKHLTWNNHVTRITNKIARTVGMINNLKKILPFNILHVLYNCLVLPHLNYGILAWGRQTKELDIIHKKVIRTLTMSKLKLLKVKDICKLQEIKCYFKLINRQLPHYFNNFNYQDNLEIHHHNTRSRLKLHNPRTNHIFVDQNLRHSMIQTINHVPNIVKEKICTHSLNGLTAYAKRYFVDTYDNMCNIANCYVCQS